MSDIKIQQVLLPKQVFIGDKAELHCTFNSANEGLKELTAKGSCTLPLEAFTQGLDFSNFEVKQILLSQTGQDYYQLTISFVPWQTGSLQFPPLAIQDSRNTFFLEFQPVEISSILEEKKISSLKESQAPLLLPGTSYKIYGLLLIFTILLIIIIRLIVKRRSLSFFVKRMLLDFKCWRNKKNTERKLKSLLIDQKLSDKDWAEKVQKTLRHYLSVKFQLDFSKKTTSEILPAIFEVTAGLLEEKNESLARITEIFMRTDYVRYSGHNELLKNEKKEVTDDLLKAISIIENKNKGGKND